MGGRSLSQLIVALWKGKWQYGKQSWALMITKPCIVREECIEKQTLCLDDPAVLVSVAFATKLRHGKIPRMIRSVVQLQEMEFGNVIWIEVITREGLQK